MAFSYPGSDKGAVYRDAIYDACIKAGGILGDRATPKATANFQVLRQTNAPAVLMEYGFMDSRVDAPVILTDAYARKMAYATMEGIAKVAGLRKKEIYRVQLGEFAELSDAQAFLQALKDLCVGAVVVKEEKE